MVWPQLHEAAAEVPIGFSGVCHSLIVLSFVPYVCSACVQL